MKQVLFFSILFTIGICLSAQQSWRLGIENIENHLAPFKNKKIALVANQCSTNRHGTHTLDILRNQGFNIICLLAPEHGFSGTIAAGATVPDQKKSSIGIPIKSLYQQGSHHIAPDTLNTVEAIFFDLPHCGMRHYTYISTLKKILEYASEHAMPIVVFDRPNPLGALIEGPLVEPDLQSFISIAPIPLRYGLTMGELAHYFNSFLLKQPAQLTIIPLHAYSRAYNHPELQKPLSPNIPTLQSGYGYSFLGLLEEITPFFAGSNTKKPFKCILLPEKISRKPTMWKDITALLKQYTISSKPMRLYQERTRTWYHGLELTFHEIITIRSFPLLLEILRTCKRHGIRLKMSASFDKAIGTRSIQQYIKGDYNYTALVRTINNDLMRFYKQARGCFLYNPKPVLRLLNDQSLRDSTTYAKRYERSHAAKKSSIA